MPQWLRRLCSKIFVRTVYAPEVQALGSPALADREGILLQLGAEGYEKHEPVFKALQLLLRSTERQAFRIPKLKTPADLELWALEQYGLVREANALRHALRLPLEGAKLKARLATAAKAKEEAEKAAQEEADLD